MFDSILKKIKFGFIALAVEHPKKILLSGFLITLIFLSAFPYIKTDTDPVHMLPQDNPVVTLHNQVKQDFNVSDIVALGVESRNGKTLFTPEILNRLKKITDEILLIKDVDGSDIFITEDLLSITTIDDIVKNEKGELLVTKLVTRLPQSQNEANEILERLNNNPMLGGKVAAKDGSLVGIFIPLANGKKDRSYYLSQKIKEIAQKHLTNDQSYYFAGLPVAESTFGNEMFIQMAVYAPMAGLVIFLLLLLFFKSVKVVIAPMALAMMAVIWSMGALVFSGNVIHIMSSMIPIFIMPIAVLDSVHILSVLSTKIGKGLTRKDAIKEVILDLFNPMFYTSLTTVIGFASLATTGIPPVMVFGVTVAFGVAISFLLTIIFIPAYTMLVSEGALSKFGHVESPRSMINRLMNFLKSLSTKGNKTILVFSILLIATSIIGVSKIIINDNPVRWFKKDHELRIADVQMNNALAGTYMTNLVFSFDQNESEHNTDSDDDFSEEVVVDHKTIKDAEVIKYIDQVGLFLQSLKDVKGNYLIGGTTSISDVIKKVGQVALGKSDLPKTREEVSQYMFLFESGDIKKGRDMWKLITRGDSKKAQMWIHFKSGDNQNMNFVRSKLDEYIKNNPVPVIDGETLNIKWSGLMQINSVWQDEMVKGMKDALIGSFIIVFFMMTILFRSVSWSVVAMLPLSITILFIYGAIGFSGKYYDMPIAVLSSLTLGLSIDFAIHFVEHAVKYNKSLKDYRKTFDKLFSGTAQAIWRNVLVIAVGFVPLFFAALQPYFTVGMFFFLIMLVSGVTTLLVIPSILITFHKYLPGFKGE